MGAPIETETPAASRADHKTDPHAWAGEQAALLRAGRLTEVDAATIAEALDEVGSEQCDKLESALRVLLTHMLTWDDQPEHRGRSWGAAIRTQRKHVLQSCAGTRA